MSTLLPNYVSTQWLNVATALTKQLRDLQGYRSPDSSAQGVPVFFGPEPDLTSQRLTSLLCIGWSGDPDTPSSAGSAQYDPAALDISRPRDELGTISCRAIAQTGNSSDSAIFETCTAAYQLLHDVDRLTRLNPTLGLPANTVQWCFVENSQPMLMSAGGSVAIIDFSLQYRARLSAAVPMF
jgi:hypothetical protein